MWAKLYAWIERHSFEAGLVGALVPALPGAAVSSFIDGQPASHVYVVFLLCWVLASIALYFAIYFLEKISGYFGHRAKQDRIASTLRDYGAPSAMITLKLAAGIWRDSFDIYLHHPQLTRLKNELSKDICPSLVFVEPFSVPSEFAKISVSDFARYLFSIGELRENLWPIQGQLEALD